MFSLLPCSYSTPFSSGSLTMAIVSEPLSGDGAWTHMMWTNAIGQRQPRPPLPSSFCVVLHSRCKASLAGVALTHARTHAHRDTHTHTQTRPCHNFESEVTCTHRLSCTMSCTSWYMYIPQLAVEIAWEVSCRGVIWYRSC